MAETIERYRAGARSSSKNMRSARPHNRLLRLLSGDTPEFGDAQKFHLTMRLPDMLVEAATAFAGGSLTISVSSFYNCREAGLVYSTMQPDGTLRSFCLYEHRNSDSIIINGCTDWDGTGLPYAGNSKNDFFAEFAPGSYRQAADALSFYLVEAARGELAGDDVLVATAEHRDWLAILSECIEGFADWAIERGARPADRMRGLDTDAPHVVE